MKIGLISDVHADPLSLELAWSHLTILGADRIVCAGDVVGYGPFPDKTVAFLESRKIATIRGNHDRWALERGPGRRDEFGGGPVSARSVEFLRTLPPDLLLEHAGRVLVMVHGTPASDLEYVRRTTHPPHVLDDLLERLDADVLVTGHTHAPMRLSGLAGLVVNPGSAISMPVVRTSRTFAMLDMASLTVSFHDLESGREIDVPSWD